MRICRSRVIAFNLCLIACAGLLAISPPVSFAGDGGTTCVLRSASCEFTIDPASMMVVAKPKSGREFRISQAVPGLGAVSDLKHDDTQVSWTLPEKKASVSMKLEGDDLVVSVRVEEPSLFTWPVIRGEEPLKALIWPNWEGKYIPLDDERWIEFLVDNGGWDTLEGLTMPFWGLDCGEYSITYIVTNRYNNEIRFTRQANQVSAEFTHEFPPNHSPREYGFVISVGGNGTPVEPAVRFRKWLTDRGEFVTMKQKMVKTPKVDRLPGSLHIYLWGDAYLAKENIRSPENASAKIWKPFTRQLVAESTSTQPAVGGQLKKLMGAEQWNDVVEMTKAPYDYAYLQLNIANELSRLIALPEFFDEASWQGVALPDEAKALLARDRSSLSPKELCRMNGLLLHAAYPQYMMPLDEWGGGLSVSMLKKMNSDGFDRLTMCLAGKEGVEMRPEVAAEADKLGYLFGIYDSFHSIHDPKLKGTDATWPTAQFNQELYDKGAIVRKDGTVKKGFKQKGHNLSPIAARPYVEDRVTTNFAKVPYNYYFVDCDAYGQVFDDYTTGRMVTQHEDAMERNRRMKWITDRFDAVIGSEGGSSYSAPAIHVAEGMFISGFGWGDADLKDKASEYYEGGYFPPDTPAIFFKPSKLKDKYRYLNYDPRFRLPLFEVVFHDSVVATNHWSKDNLKHPDEKDTVFLIELLYQVPPMFHVSAGEYAKRKGVMKEQFDFFSPLNRELAFSQMTGFEWLTSDRLVQKTVFADKVEIIANFSENGFPYQDKKVPAGSVMAHWTASGETKVYTPREPRAERK
jgi:hypothetical protein